MKGGSPRKLTSGRKWEWLLSGPSFSWLVVFFAIPTALIVLLSFKARSLEDGFAPGYDFEAWRRLWDGGILGMLGHTLWLSLATTLICVIWSLPVAWFLAKAAPRWRSVVLWLIMVPFWTNFLIRVFAWKSVAHPSGPLMAFLYWTKLMPEESLLLYNSGAVLLVLVYAHLPFAILPLFAAVDRFDFGLLDAARDLGAGPASAFFRIFLPGIRQGMLSAAALVFIPALGAYLIPDLVGGSDGQMLGNLIARRVGADRDWPQAAAMATLLVMASLLPLVAVWQWKRPRKSTAPDPALAPDHA
ncbi:MAG: ABC transporter permease [Verrucomicrobiales bacterium]